MNAPAPADGLAWDAFVAAAPEGTVFHSFGWMRAVTQAFGLRSFPLVERQAGQVTGVLPLVEVGGGLFARRLVANAFAVAGGPLAASAAARQALLSVAGDLGAGLKAAYVELRDTAPGDGWTEGAPRYATFARAIAPGTEDEVLKQVPRKQRAVIRKSLQSDLADTIDADARDFYPLYARTMRDHGTPVFPRSWIEALLQAFGPQADILTVRHRGQAVSSVLSFYDHGHVRPYYTGSRPDARTLGANDYMYFKLMMRGLARGCTAFDFGRSKEGTGPYAFKCNWGFAPRPVRHQYKLFAPAAPPDLSPANPRFGAAVWLWRRLPLGVANLAGPVISRGLG